MDMMDEPSQCASMNLVQQMLVSHRQFVGRALETILGYH